MGRQERGRLRTERLNSLLASFFAEFRSDIFVFQKAFRFVVCMNVLLF